jgi:hypothetical protein
VNFSVFGKEKEKEENDNEKLAQCLPPNVVEKDNESEYEKKS